MTHKTMLQAIHTLISRKTIGRYDLPALLGKPDISQWIVQTLAAPYRGKADWVAAPEAVGWIFGALVAKALGRPFLPIRKGGRLPYPPEVVIGKSYIDYTGAEKRLEMHRDSIVPGSRVLVVDDWVETGAAMSCCMDLMASARCRVIGLAAIGVDCRRETAEWMDTGFITYIGKDL